MDVKVKQRLIGALVLGALAVIFVPMIVLGPEPEGAADAASVPITPPDAPQGEFITREIPLGPQPLPSAVPGVIPAPSGDPNALATVDATATVAPRVDALDADAAVAVDAVTGQPAAAPTAATPVRPSPAAAPAPAPAPAPMPAAVAAGSYVVNAGSFGNRANAEALLGRLRAAGLAARSEPVDINGQPGTRISVGPFDTRAAAEAARVRTAAMSGSASVSASDAVPSAAAAAAPSAARPSAASAAPAASGFAVQLGAFSSETEAQALVARAQGEGFAAFQQRTPTANGMLWRVRLGPAADRAAAERMKSDAAGKLGVSGIVVSHP